MEDSNINKLPPSKRFKLLQTQSEPKPINKLPPSKRFKLLQTQSEPKPLCLPAKKRIWAPPPPSPSDLQEPDQPTEKQQAVADADGDEDDDDGVLCAVCRSTDGDPSDPIVFCDGCDLMVHSSCYGNPLIESIPEGDWFCLRCQNNSKSSDEQRSNCCLCPVKGGAVKPTVDGKWAHIVCAVLVPEVFFRDPEGREGIDCSEVPSGRREVECYVCGCRSGCGIECSEPKCGLGFHVGCGIEEGLSIEYKKGKGGGGGIVAGFCGEHTKLWEKQQQTGKFKIVARDSDAKRKVRD